ncbi:MAG: ACT domain-containing protein [Oscillospiraceae bacterium]|nr:ACT domain-containing protein [Oscillospiraceae bacterium]
MRAVVTVVGRDTVGIISSITRQLSENNVNIMDISQSILQDLFAMVMLVDISGSKLPFSRLAELLSENGKEMGVKVHVMHEDIFTSMHRI